MRRGEIWEAHLHPRSGAEQSGKRPVLILSNDGFNAINSWQSVIVIPFSTSESQARRGPTAVPLKKGQGGLKRASTALCHQVTTLDRAKLAVRWGALDEAEMHKVEEGLKAAIDL